MRRWGWLFVGGITMVGLVWLATLPQEGAQAQNQPVRRLLFVNRSMGFRHEATATAAEIVVRLGWGHGPAIQLLGLPANQRLFLTTVTEDTDLLAPDILQRYDAVMFYTTGELPLSATQRQALLDFVKGGRGFVGVHSATDTFYQWADYGEMIGGYFDGHPWHQPVRAVVEDPNHPATRHLGSVWAVTDEIYQHRNWSRERVRVLLRLDPTSVDITKGKRIDQDYALAWCRQYGKGRVFYTALGHREELWRDAKFQAHLLGGILWAMGVLPGEATPRPKPQ